MEIDEENVIICISYIIKDLKWNMFLLGKLKVWSEYIYLSGYVKICWFRVIKLVFWLDINYVNDEIL